MRRNSTSSMGALHPVMFFLLIYGISLFLAIFVCRTVYYSLNGDVSHSSKTVEKYTAAMDATASIR